MLLLLNCALVAGQMTAAVISAYKAVLCLIVCKALLCVSFHHVGLLEKKIKFGDNSGVMSGVNWFGPELTLDLTPELTPN